MLELKYFRMIEAAQAATLAAPPAASSGFDLGDLGRHGQLWHTVWRRMFLCVFWLMRGLMPNLRIGRLVIVTRDQDVRQVLDDDKTFITPFGPEMRELAQGADFVLGVEGRAHDELNLMIRKVMRPADAERLKQIATRWAAGLIAGSGGRIDVMHDLFARVATETCNEYFGLDLPDPDAFADWTVAMNALLFADWFGDPATRRLALAAATRARVALDRAIERARARRALAPPAQGCETVLDRLLDLQQAPGGPTDGSIRATLMGLATGFIPTTTLAAGNILDQLLRWPQALKDAVDAAAAGDAAALQAILLEAARLDPTLSPGQLRFADKAGVIAPRTWRRLKVSEGAVVLVATMSALRDPRAFPAPNSFDAARKQKPELLFGCGPHWCLGQFVAEALLTSVFAVLLRQKNLHPCRDRVGKRAYVGFTYAGPYPRRFDMVFDPATAPAEQTMVTICAPLRADADAVALKKRVCALGNPAQPQIAAALAATGIVHFASMSVAELGADDAPAPHLLLEFNVDGAQDDALSRIAHAAGPWLDPIFREVDGPADASLLDLLRSHALTLHFYPWGATGLNFCGVGEFPVADIERQERLAEASRRALDAFELNTSIRDRGPMQRLDYVRDWIRNNTDLGDFLIRPSRRRLAFAAWTEPGLAGGAEALLKSPVGRGVAGILAGLALLLGGAIYVVPAWDRGGATWFALTLHLLAGLVGGVLATVVAIGLLGGLYRLLRPEPPSPGGEQAAPPASAGFRRTAGWLGAAIVVLGGWSYYHFTPAASIQIDLLFVAYMLRGIIGGPLLVVLLVVALGAVLALVLRWHEIRDRPDDRNPNLTDMEAIAASENHPGFAQNHITAVTPLKPGLFRRLTLALGLWGISLSVAYWFRPGFVLTMGTIHYAKWFRVPGTGKLVFLANYDGSWESYLEDFITKAHWGQSAAWSNAVGFPRTRFLVLDGAQDGDRFKRWVRRQQKVTQFWYSRFPTLTADQIRTNALIHDGLMRAADDTMARAWLDLFGSMTLPTKSIETDEIQSLVFRGLRDLPHAAAVVLRLPQDAAARRHWLQHAIAEVSFGDRPFGGNALPEQKATFVAFSALGLAKLGVPEDGMGTFPAPFTIGMAGRGHILGDAGVSDAARWCWADGGRDDAADALLLIFAKTAASCAAALGEHAARLGADAILHRIDTQPAPGGVDYEHFGFRDGISQPIVRGTQRSTRETPARDIVEPGEFIFGYPSNEGYFPPTPVVRPESDPNNRLPVEAAAFPSRYPYFGSAKGRRTRDLGRNGTFIAVRQLRQDVDGFKEFTQTQAKRLRRYPDAAALVDRPIDANWVAAKMLGRWQDGTPLIHSPEEPPCAHDQSAALPCGTHGHGRGPSRRRADDNDFDFGTEDPQGLQCPLGAHIRRANPRTSLVPGDATQQAITNRHRLIRRGRSYQEGDEKGLLFIGLCADLERQFEFIQQTWIGSPNFHGLDHEPDPIATPSTGGAAATDRVFTIPTVAAPLVLEDMRSFVTVRGGGYFFLPSRAALRYLIDLS